MLVGNEPCRKPGGEVVFVCEQWAMPEAWRKGGACLWAMSHAGSPEAKWCLVVSNEPCWKLAGKLLRFCGIRRIKNKSRAFFGEQAPHETLCFIFSMAHCSQKKHHPQGSCVLKNGTCSGPPGVRTLDTLIKSQVLYQLS